MAPQLLTSAERDEHLTPLLMQGWQFVEERDAIKKTFIFKDFVECFAFMKSVADKAEETQHHPEWFNVYNLLEITWSTHDCSGLSKLDVELANYCESLFKGEQ